MAYSVRSYYMLLQFEDWNAANKTKKKVLCYLRNIIFIYTIGNWLIYVFFFAIVRLSCNEFCDFLFPFLYRSIENAWVIGLSTW